MVCSESELTSATMNPFRHTGSTPWMGDQVITMPLPTHNSITQKKQGHISMP